MKNHRISWGIVALIVLVTTAISFGPSLTHSQQEKSKQQDLMKYRVVDFDATATRDKNTNEAAASNPLQNQSESFPAVLYSAQDAINYAKGMKYEKSMRVLSTEISKDIDSLSGVRWFEGLSALPVKSSNIIVSGVVSEVKANLSANKSTVYTTIKIKTDEVFKNSREQGVGNFIEAEREGGKVIYPSGFTFWHRLAGQQIPKVGNKYLFFLTNEFPVIGHSNGDLYLLAAYQLTEDGVVPLDDPGESRPIFSKYLGKPKEKLLKDLRESLND